MVGTAAEVTPVRELDDRSIGIGSRGPITEKVQSAYFDAVRGVQSPRRHLASHRLTRKRGRPFQRAPQARANPLEGV